MPLFPTCDICKGNLFPLHDPFVKHCQRRPSDPLDMCCTMWGHWQCFTNPGSAYKPKLPRAGSPIGANGALATPTDLEAWIDSIDALAHGYQYIT